MPEVAEELNDSEFSDAFAEATQGDEAKADIVEESEEEVVEEVAEEVVEEEPVDELAAVTGERDDYKHKFESNVGRINSYQRTIKELTEKLDSKEPEPEIVDDNTDNKDWDELKEDFPEIASALDSRLKSRDDEVERLVKQRLGSLEEQIQPLAQQAHNNEIQLQFAALEAAHPDYKDVSGSNEFHNWLEQKPEPVQKLIDSNNAADAAYLLDTFKQETGIKREDKSSHIKQVNREKLASNVSVPSTRNPKRELSDDDFSSAFSAAVESKKRSRMMR